MYAYRNITKKAKTTRHEKEKAYMQQLRCAGATVGEYVGNGQGETEHTETEDKCDDAEPVVDDHHECEDTSVGSSDDANPLLIFYDCETTGFSIYSEHITEIAAKVAVFIQPTNLLKPSEDKQKHFKERYTIMNTF